MIKIKDCHIEKCGRGIKAPTSAEIDIEGKKFMRSLRIVNNQHKFFIM